MHHSCWNSFSTKNRLSKGWTLQIAIHLFLIWLMSSGFLTGLRHICKKPITFYLQIMLIFPCTIFFLVGTCNWSSMVFFHPIGWIFLLQCYSFIKNLLHLWRGVSFLQCCCFLFSFYLWISLYWLTNTIYMVNLAQLHFFCWNIFMAKSNLCLKYFVVFLKAIASSGFVLYTW